MGATLPPLLEKSWSDARLVRECLKGSEEAWAALVDKYKNLIYSIPIKYGLSQDDAADVFQSVCLEALAQLGTLREPNALAKWLIQIAAHKSYRFKQLQSRSVPLEDDFEQEAAWGHTPPGAETILQEAEHEQSLRTAIAALTPRCQEMLRMLFFEQPALPYEEVARRLGIANGSIGFIRARCLKKLRKQIEAPEGP